MLGDFHRIGTRNVCLWDIENLVAMTEIGRKAVVRTGDDLSDNHRPQCEIGHSH